jgi:DNA replication and repair protein RecF
MFKSLRLENFRSYEKAEFELGPGINIVVGPNGSGKTSILEALYLIDRGVSFRGEASSLIRRGAEWARVDAADASHRYALKLQSGEGGTRKSLLADDKPVARGATRTILFEPDQLRVVHGPPELRRAWLDELLGRLEASYPLALKNYQRALRQRNSLLAHGSSDDLFVWEMKMSEYGALVAEGRRGLVERLNERLNELYQAVSGSRDVLQLGYSTPFGENYSSDFLAALGNRRDSERRYGFTTVGPHREDLTINFNGLPAAPHASRGERRTIYLSLKFMELGLIETAYGQKVVLLLDDLFGELDDRRKRHLQAALHDHQIIITSTDDHPIQGALPAAKRVIRLR